MVSLRRWALIYVAAGLLFALPGVAVGVLGGVVAGAASFVTTLLALGAAYVLAGATSLRVLDRGDAFARLVLLGCGGSLVVYAVLWQVVGPLARAMASPSAGLPLAVPFATAGLVLAVPLGLARDRRHQWIAVALVVLAAAPPVAVGAVLGATPSRDPLLFLAGLLGWLALLVLGYPLYALSRDAARRATDRSASPVPPLTLAVGLTGVLLAGTVHAFRTELVLRESPVGIAFVLLVVVLFAGVALRLAGVVAGPDPPE